MSGLTKRYVQEHRIVAAAVWAVGNSAQRGRQDKAPKYRHFPLTVSGKRFGATAVDSMNTLRGTRVPTDLKRLGDIFPFGKTGEGPLIRKTIFIGEARCHKNFDRNLHPDCSDAFTVR